MGLFKFKNKKRKKKTGDDSTESSAPATTSNERLRVDTVPLRKLKSPSERMDVARKDKQARERLANKSIATTLQAPKKSWLTRTKAFQNMCESAFNLIDADGSGEVDEKELYSGLLLIHLKLGCYAGPAACRPLSREKCGVMFLKFDKDNSGYLDRHEFVNVMGVLFGNVLSRVLMQYSLTLMLVPFVAKLFVDLFTMGWGGAWHFVSTLDEHSSVANQIELLVEMVADMACQFYRAVVPGLIQSGGDAVTGLLAKVPASVWVSLPLTLTSAVLGSLIVPRSIMMTDDFFQNLADNKAKQL